MSARSYEDGYVLELLDTVGWLADELERVQSELPTGQDPEATRAIQVAKDLLGKAASYEPPICEECFGDGIAGEPGDEPGTGHTWKCTKCNGTELSA